MSIVFWVVASLLATVFVLAGSTKLLKNRTALLADPRMGWAVDFTAGQLRLIGLAEVLGAVVMIAAVAFGIVPLLSPIAALGLAALMIGAVVTHTRRGESAAPAIVLAALSLTVVVLYRFVS